MLPQIINQSLLTPEFFNSVKKNASLVYNVVDASDDEVKITFTGFVGDEWEGNDPATFANLLTEHKGKRFRVQINSAGGLVHAGTHILDLLNQYEGEVITEIYGMTASAATIFSQAGKRRMSKNAKMLIHHGWTLAIGNQFTMQIALDTLQSVDQLILDIYNQRAKNADEIKELMGANNGDGKWIDADQALEYGLIDEVFDPADKKVKMVKAQSLHTAPEVIKQEETSTEEAQAQISERKRKLINIKKRQ
jgi:ATP-dependent protease ClpP protease subunit